MKTGLTIEVLGPIWAIADHDTTGELDLAQFYVALRLISLAQNGEQISEEALRAAKDARLPLQYLMGFLYQIWML